MRRTLALATLTFLTLGLASCSDNGPEATLEPALGGHTFDAPLDMAALPDGSFLVVERAGQLLLFGSDSAETVLDLSEAVSLAHEEQGLLSVAPDPAFAENGHVWLYYIAK